MWELMGSLLTGGATGLLGSLFSGVMEFFKQKQRNEHELKIMNAEREIMALEIESRERVAVIDAETQRDIQDSQLMAVSIDSDAATYSQGNSKWLVLVDVVRGLTRPLLTSFLGLFMVLLWFSTDDLELKTKIITTALYIATTCFFWWFGTRLKMVNYK